MKDKVTILSAVLAAAIVSGCSTTEPAPPQAEETVEQPAAVETPEAAPEVEAKAEVIPAVKITPAKPVEAKPVPEETPAGQLGQKAAALEGLTMIKGEPVTFVDGQVYVVEFWATWCGPCRTSIPHLTKIQAEYKDKGVTVIGISTEKDLATIEAFVTEQGEKMEYTVAMDAEGKASAGYMTAFKQRGIPSAFIVDAKGLVAWFGHPMSDMDGVLEKVVAGTFDQETYAQEKAERDAAEQALRKLYQEYITAVQGGATIEETRPTAETFIESAPPVALNALAWQIMSIRSVDDSNRDLEIALKAVTKANADTDGENPIILDTYAMALSKTGQLKEALAAAEKAVGLAADNERLQADMKVRLEALKELIEKEATGTEETP